MQRAISTSRATHLWQECFILYLWQPSDVRWPHPTGHFSQNLCAMYLNCIVPDISHNRKAFLFPLLLKYAVKLALAQMLSSPFKQESCEVYCWLTRFRQKPVHELSIMWEKLMVGVPPPLRWSIYWLTTMQLRLANVSVWQLCWCWKKIKKSGYIFCGCVHNHIHRATQYQVFSTSCDKKALNKKHVEIQNSCRYPLYTEKCL